MDKRGLTGVGRDGGVGGGSVGVGGGSVGVGGGSIGVGEEYWNNTSPGSMKNMKDSMYESEQRRLALVEKLREAHETLQVSSYTYILL